MAIDPNQAHFWLALSVQWWLKIKCSETNIHIYTFVLNINKLLHSKEKYPGNMHIDTWP